MPTPSPTWPADSKFQNRILTESLAPSILFSLPPELRLIVYASVVSTFDIDLKRTDAGCPSFEPPLLQSGNSTIRNEAMQAYYCRLDALIDEAGAERYAATVRLLAVLNKRLDLVVPWELQYALSEDDAAVKKFERLGTMVELEVEKMKAEGFPVSKWRERKQMGSFGVRKFGG